ncbi:MAG: TolC family protein, partial [Desulfofustis sp.]|nr:TolC family protein [Desulfofustis sp.]
MKFLAYLDLEETVLVSGREPLGILLTVRSGFHLLSLVGWRFARALHLNGGYSNHAIQETWAYNHTCQIGEIMKSQHRTGGGSIMLFPIAAMLLGLSVLHPANEALSADKGYGLSELVQEAMANNNELQSLEEKARALRAEAPFFGSLQDPKIGFIISNLPTDTFDFDQEAMTQKVISIDQQIPWFGTLDLAEQGAELMAVEQEAMAAAARLSVARQVKEAWYELAFIERSLEINDRLRDII